MFVMVVEEEVVKLKINDSDTIIQNYRVMVGNGCENNEWIIIKIKIKQ